MNKLVARLVARLRTFFYQSQEFTLWLPGLVVLAVIGYVVLGSIARIGDDALAWLAELPVHCAWAAAWLGCAWLIQRLYGHDLTREEEIQLHAQARDGNAGARWVLVFHRLQLVVFLVLSLLFFLPAR